MSLLSEKIKKKAESQYKEGSDMDQEIVAKFFNPTGKGDWYLMNKDPKSGYCWGIVDLFAVEVGSFDIRELEEISLPFGMKIERDEYFTPMKAKDLFEKLVKNKVH